MFNQLGAAKPAQHEAKQHFALTLDKKSGSPAGQACLSGHQATPMLALSSEPPSLSGRSNSVPSSDWELLHSQKLVTRHCRSSSPGTGEVVTAIGNMAEGRSNSMLSSGSEDSIIVLSTTDDAPTLGSESQILGNAGQNSGSAPRFPAENSSEHRSGFDSKCSSFTVISDESAQPSLSLSLQFQSWLDTTELEKEAMCVESSAQDEKQIQERVVNDNATTEAGLTYSEAPRKDNTYSQQTLDSKADQRWFQHHLATRNPAHSTKAHEKTTEAVFRCFFVGGQQKTISYPPVQKRDMKPHSLHHSQSTGFNHYVQRHSETVPQEKVERHERRQESSLMSIDTKNKQINKDYVMARNVAANEQMTQKSLLMSIYTKNKQINDDYVIAQNVAANEKRTQKSLLMSVNKY